MKLATSTLGCPDWSLSEILDNVKSYGYDGVELRGLGPDLDLTQSPHFATKSALEQTRRTFADAGLEICSVDTSAAFADPARAKQGLAEARNALTLAHALDAPFVRVFGGSVPAGATRVQAIQSLVASLRALGEDAEKSGDVTVILETHDDFSTGAQVAEVLTQVAHPRVAALWDLHHPYRQGESPEETWAALGAFVRHVHVKDSRPPDDYCLLAEGDIPILTMLRLLKHNGYDGWISLEWEKRWHPRLADPSVAFPQYAAQLREMLAQL
ncbi:MAG: sugar phosphate isomerase/epimerase [Armatimonadota bacterium]|nr:sugar phosphate isomerase/epimerase [Armatimonadota bacterium]